MHAVRQSLTGTRYPFTRLPDCQVTVHRSVPVLGTVGAKHLKAHLQQVVGPWHVTRPPEQGGVAGACGTRNKAVSQNWVACMAVRPVLISFMASDSFHLLYGTFI